MDISDLSVKIKSKLVGSDESVKGFFFLHGELHEAGVQPLQNVFIVQEAMGVVP